LADNYSFSLNLKNNDWTFRITFIEYRPVDLGDAYLQTKHLNGSAGDEGVRPLTAGLNVGSKTINEEVKNEEVSAVPAGSRPRATKEETARQRIDEEVKTRRFQK
jgi:hypothetical protein